MYRVIKELKKAIGLIPMAAIMATASCANDTNHTKPTAHHSHQKPLADNILVSSNQCFKASSNWQQQVKLQQHFGFHFNITESCVAAKNIQQLKLFIDMPEHRHGINTTPEIIRDNLTFNIEGILLHMPGLWRVQIELAYKDQNQTPKLETITFDSTL